MFELINAMKYYILLIAIVTFLRTPLFKGWFGELMVKIHLKRLDNEKYKVLNDITVQLEDGTTAQIDHIVVSKYGVFVIETKNYKGWIVGNENAYYWKQVIYKRKEKLYNPLIQNDVHIKRLEEVLENINDIKFISIVAFTLRADIKVKTDKNLIYSLKLPKTIRKYKEEVMDEHKVNQIYEAIKILNIKDKTVKKEHISRIKNYKKEEKKKCPQCQSELILRSGKYGKFWGCSDYPKCKYTKQISK